ncbi:MAG: cation:proton antiporter domain-containing protein [Candidatus Limnocylindrales bacterium]
MRRPSPIRLRLATSYTICQACWRPGSRPTRERQLRAPASRCALADQHQRVETSPTLKRACSELPSTLVLVLVGLVVTALPMRSELGQTPAAAVAILLAGLVFEAAYRGDGDELQRTFGGVALLAVPGVLVTAAVVAVVLHPAAGVALGQALLVGAIVAVASTMRHLDAPMRLVTLVDAESRRSGSGYLWRPRAQLQSGVEIPTGFAVPRPAHTRGSRRQSRALRSPSVTPTRRRSSPPRTRA